MTPVMMADVHGAAGANGMTAAVLFAGAGGTSIGVMLAEFRIVFVNEWYDVAADSYKLNMPGLRVDRRDVALVTGVDLLTAADGQLHVLFASPPCQDLSRAGRGNLGGENMARYYEAVRIVLEARPLAFCFENVEPLVQDPAYGRHFVPITDRLRAGGYRVAVRVLDSCRYGVPQTRRRAITIGFREDTGARAGDAFPSLGPVCAIRDALPDVRRFVRRGRPVRDVTHYRYRAEDLEWRGCDPGPTLTTSGFSIYGRARMRAETRDGSWRRVSVADAIALSGFPADFQFPPGTSEAAAWRMLGNSWPPPVPERCARQIARLLASSEQGSDAA